MFFSLLALSTPPHRFTQFRLPQLCEHFQKHVYLFSLTRVTARKLPCKQCSFTNFRLSCLKALPHYSDSPLNVFNNALDKRYIGAFFNLLKPTGHVTHQQFNIQQLYVLPTLYLCVLFLSENKQRLVPLTA